MGDNGVDILSEVREAFSEEVPWSPDLGQVRESWVLCGESVLGRGFSPYLSLFPIHLVAQARNLAVLTYPFLPLVSPKFIGPIILGT